MFKAGQRRVRQPQVSPAAVERFKLTSLVLPGLSNFDYVSKERLGSVAASPTKIVGPHGKQLLLNASREAIYGTATGRQKGTGAAASIVWVGELFTSPDAYASLGGITYDASNSSPYVYLELKRNFAANNLFLSHSVGGSAANITNSGVYTTGWVVIVAAVTSGRQVMYSRSATVRERVSGTTTGSMASTATSRLEIGESLNARNPQAACAMQAMSSVAWSDATMERILANPWQVAAPLPRRIWVPVSAGGGAATDLTIQEAAHAHGADNLALTVATGLTVADAAHAHTADNITLTTGGANLAVDEALHAHAVDNLALTLDTFLAVQDATHSHIADNFALTLDVFLTIADALHAQAADNVTLTVGGIDLIIAEALHAHAADNLAFTLDTFLAVADALHAQTADNLTLSLGGALSDAEFRQMYDWLQDLYGRQLLTVGTFLALK